MAEDADINVIMKRFGITGQMPNDVRMPEYGDFTEAQDYQEALHVLMYADEQFMRLPGDLRARFQNDPAKFMDFFHDPKNADELITLGLRNAPAPKPVPLEVIIANAKANPTNTEPPNQAPVA